MVIKTKKSTIFKILVLTLLCLNQNHLWAQDLPSVDIAVCIDPNPFVAKEYMDKNKDKIDQFDNQMLKTMAPSDVFKYLSGNTNPYNNFPIIYAHGSKEGKKITVSGCGYYKEFLISHIDEAIDAYRKLLILNRYSK